LEAGSITTLSVPAFAGEVFSSATFFTTSTGTFSKYVLAFRAALFFFVMQKQ
jgi:hypothetical protein